jgi:serine/threonine protein kinase
MRDDIGQRLSNRKFLSDNFAKNLLYFKFREKIFGAKRIFIRGILRRVLKFCMAKTIDSVAESKFGKFYLRELLNSGGMSEIWLVGDGRGKNYALRKLKKDLRFNFKARKRFWRGCEILEKIGDGENIVGYVEHGRAEGTMYLLMDYVEAENLKELFARQDPILSENVAQILIDMASGLSHVHENGFMHLDFKPENVLVTRNANVRLIDFDMALPIPETPKKLSENPGTPGYMAPEQLRGEPVDARADIFAFGVSAYEIMANQKPFPGETPAEILAAQLSPGGPISLREYNADVPADLEKVILKCLERDPEKRYLTSGMMLRELQSALYV